MKSEVMLMFRIGYTGLVHLKFTKRTSAFIIDETIIQIKNQHFWLWFCIEPVRFKLEIILSERKKLDFFVIWF